MTDCQTGARPAVGSTIYTHEAYTRAVKSKSDRDTNTKYKDHTPSFIVNNDNNEAGFSFIIRQESRGKRQKYVHATCIQSLNVTYLMSLVMYRLAHVT